MIISDQCIYLFTYSSWASRWHTWNYFLSQVIAAWQNTWHGRKGSSPNATGKKSSAVNRSELGGLAVGAPPPIHPLGTLWLKWFLISFTGSKAVDSPHKGCCGYGKPPQDSLFIPHHTVTKRCKTNRSLLHVGPSALTQLRQCISVAPRVPSQTVLFLATQCSLPAFYFRNTRERRLQYQSGVHTRHRTRNISTRAVDIQHRMPQATLIISKKLMVGKDLLMLVSDITNIFA